MNFKLIIWVIKNIYFFSYKIVIQGKKIFKIIRIINKVRLYSFFPILNFEFINKKRPNTKQLKPEIQLLKKFPVGINGQK